MTNIWCEILIKVVISNHSCGRRRHLDRYSLFWSRSATHLSPPCFWWDQTQLSSLPVSCQHSTTCFKTSGTPTNCSSFKSFFFSSLPWVRSEHLSRKQDYKKFKQFITVWLVKTHGFGNERHPNAHGFRLERLLQCSQDEHLLLNTCSSVVSLWSRLSDKCYYNRLNDGFLSPTGPDGWIKSLLLFYALFRLAPYSTLESQRCEYLQVIIS